MENYIVSARKYRPATFDTVVGQRALTTTLKNAIANQKLAHAYLFCGPAEWKDNLCTYICENHQLPSSEGRRRSLQRM